MRVLVAILSCDLYERNGNNQAMRDTWLADLAALGVEHRFFVAGENATPGDDVVVLPGSDDYWSLKAKLQGAAGWAHDRGYNFVFKCHTDTYVRPERLLAMPFQEFDYVGIFHAGQHSWEGASDYLHLTFAFGGPGYWLSRRACGYLTAGGGRSAFEDCWAHEVLIAHPEIKRCDERYFVNDGWLAKSNQTGAEPWPLKNNGVISTHLYATQPNAIYDKQVMYDTHARWLQS